MSQQWRNRINPTVEQQTPHKVEIVIKASRILATHPDLTMLRDAQLQHMFRSHSCTVLAAAGCEDAIWYFCIIISHAGFRIAVLQ